MDIMRTNMHLYVIDMYTMPCYATLKKSSGTKANNRQINDVWHEVDEIAALRSCLCVQIFMCMKRLCSLVINKQNIV